MELLQRVNADFKAILKETDAAAQMETLTEQMKQKKMDMHGELFPTFLKPYFMPISQRDLYAHVTRSIISIVEKVGAAYMSGYDFGGLIHLEGREAELSRVDPLYPNFQVMVRLDLFYHPETSEIKFLEVNCGDPSGMGWHDALLDMFLALPVMKEMDKKYALTVDYLLETQFDAVMHKYRQFCETKGIEAKEKPDCAIVCWKDSTIRGDFDLIADYYNAKGCQTSFADPGDLEYDGKRVTLKGVAIDAIYRDAMDDFLKDEFWSDCQPIINAYKDGNICFVNPVRAATGDFKTMTAVMTDEKYRGLFTDEEWETAQKHIPWTRLVREGKTDYKGKEIDLASHLRAHRADFVLKPNCGYGGFGIAIGKESTGKEWDEALEKAFRPGADYAVQEFVEIPREEFPVLDENKNLKGFEPKNVNVNFWSHDGEFAGAFVRAAGGSIINVHQGGGLVPVFYVADK